MRALKQACRWTAIVGVCLMLSITSGVRAASFDCKKASTDIEHAICDEPRRNVLDEQISARYRHLLSESPASKVSDIRSAQRTWLAGRERAEVVAAMGPARQATARWLVAQRGFSATDADKAARNVVQAWVGAHQLHRRQYR